MNDVGAIIDFVCIVGAQLSVMKIEYLIGKNTRYSVKRLWAARTFLWSKPQGDGVWIRRYLVYFDFRNHRAEPEFHGRGIWWTDGKTIKQWKRDWGEKAQYIMCQRPKLSAMLLAPSGPYQPYTLASHTDQFESDVRKVLKSEWMYQYDNHLNFPWEVRQWEIVNRYPMAESLVKTGWADALCSQVYDEYEHSTRINLRAETYYGVFGLNRQELAAVSQSKKSFREVDNALEWKEAGLAINGKNMAMTANIRKLSGMAKTLQESGMTRSLKYLRQQTRRATGSYNGRIALQVASDWLDYLDMAGQMKMNLNLEKVRFPLDLKRRHDDLVLERNKRRRKDALRGAASSIKKDAKELENQFHIENIAGIHSDEYGMLIGGEQVNDGEDFLEKNLPLFIPVSLAGRVHTKVIGPVNTGDCIVLSHIPGVGRAAKPCEYVDPCKVVGYAVEGDNLTEQRRLKVRVRGA